ncbi:NAD-dependent malic enzyme [Rhizobium tubonense]|uniref:NAD-dependent malic enzyme n=1 Tax=Rhizobium tubonense TaxID=484088 RepID=A0A2W4EYL9_9HYPH|nr:NAD-dependent malic enzyme [Rhizobium tubonense]PZM15393.1 NAD-dependent malic enzyme [Rhizobium tubonense]
MQTHTQDGREPAVKTGLFGYQLLTDPRFNKGTAFSQAERDQFELNGLLPPAIGNLDEQVSRRLQVLRSFETDIERYAFLRDLQDTNETLFFALLIENLEELLPIVYTPTVGEGCEQFSRLYRKPRGLFLSYPQRSNIERILSHPSFDDVRVIVVTDGERILGLGDQGAGGMGIPIGKLALYTGCGGIDPSATLPIFLDVGTDNAARLADPLYIGWRHERLRGQEYDDFIETFVDAVRRRWPNVLLQWEDFAKNNATRLLERYRDRLCTFNDDVQGTAAVATATLLAAMNVTGRPLAEQRFAVLGAGSAGCGISAQLTHALVEAGVNAKEARGRFFLIDRDGLQVEGAKEYASFQRPFVQAAPVVQGWKLEQPDRISLLDVVRNAKPTVLIGVSGQKGAFTQAVVKTMTTNCERPIIFPLSNPTSRAEATPEDIEHWTGGRAVIGTGSPFPPLTRDGKAFKVDQTNNSYVFPGIGLGVTAIDATRVSDGMMMAAARALAAVSPALGNSKDSLLPPIASLREVSVTVALAVALQAHSEGLVAHPVATDEIEGLIRRAVWVPRYRPYTRGR